MKLLACLVAGLTLTYWNGCVMSDGVALGEQGKERNSIDPGHWWGERTTRQELCRAMSSCVELCEPSHGLK